MQTVEETCVGENDSVSVDGNMFDVPLVDAANEFKSPRKESADPGNKRRVDSSEGGAPASSKWQRATERRPRALDNILGVRTGCGTSFKSSAVVGSVCKSWYLADGRRSSDSSSWRRIARPKLCTTNKDMRAPTDQVSTSVDSDYNTHTVKGNPNGGVNAACALDSDKGHGCRYNSESTSDGSVTQLRGHAQVRTCPE